MIFGNLAWTIELYITKYIIGEIFSSGRATLYKNPSDQTVWYVKLNENLVKNWVIISGAGGLFPSKVPLEIPKTVMYMFDANMK